MVQKWVLTVCSDCCPKLTAYIAEAAIPNHQKVLLLLHWLLHEQYDWPACFLHVDHWHFSSDYELLLAISIPVHAVEQQCSNLSYIVEIAIKFIINVANALNSRNLLQSHSLNSRKLKNNYDINFLVGFF